LYSEGETDTEVLIDNNQDVTQLRTQRAAKVALVFSMVACLGVGMVLVQGHLPATAPSPQMNKVGSEFPLLQTYIAWSPEMYSIMQKDDLPAAKDLMKDPKKMKKIAMDMFKKIDADESGDLSYKEVEAGVKFLVEKGVLDAPPDDDDIEELEKKVGKTIDKDEFMEILKGVLKVVIADGSRRLARMDKVGPELPLLQTYIAWSPEMQSLMQKDAKPAAKPKYPKAKALMKDEKLMKKTAMDMFKKIDTDKNGAISYTEVKAGVKFLVKEKILEAAPPDNEVKDLKKTLGKSIDKDEFLQILKGVMKVMMKHDD